MADKKEVTVFSTNTCPWCTVLKNYLDENKIEYKDINVGVDQAGAQMMITKSQQMGVPQMWVDDSVIVGFNKAEIDRQFEL